MRGAVKVALAALVMIGAGSAAAQADVILINRTGKSVWYTLYGASGDQISSGCITTGLSQTLRSAGGVNSGSTGTIVYVRGELKENTNCGGRTVSDTGRGGPQSVPSNGLVKTFELVNGQIRR